MRACERIWPDDRLIWRVWKTGTEMRLLVIEKAREQRWECFYCRKKMLSRAKANETNSPMRQMTADHYWPKALDGDDRSSNIVAACRGCNDRKADMRPQDYMESLGPTPKP